MSDPILNGLHETIEKAMSDLNVPGAQVAIIKDGEVIYSEAFGYANLDENIPMTKEHLLPIGSSSKSFTATAAAILAHEGKLEAGCADPDVYAGIQTVRSVSLHTGHYAGSAVSQDRSAET